jgi:hypothetical protein
MEEKLWVCGGSLQNSAGLHPQACSCWSLGGLRVPSGPIRPRVVVVCSALSCFSGASTPTSWQGSFYFFEHGPPLACRRAPLPGQAQPGPGHPKYPLRPVPKRFALVVVVGWASNPFGGLRPHLGPQPTLPRPKSPDLAWPWYLPPAPTPPEHAHVIFSVRFGP